MDVINALLDTSFTYEQFDTSITNRIEDLDFKCLIDTLKRQFSTFKINANLRLPYHNSSVNNTFPSWETIKSNFSLGPKSPILFWREFRSSDSTSKFKHISLIIGYHEIFHKNQISRELLIYDPYNKLTEAKGFRLSMNYDQFRLSVSHQKNTDDQPNWAFIHDFEPRDTMMETTNLTFISSKNLIAEDTTLWKQKKRFLQTKKRAQVKLTKTAAPYYLKQNTSYFPNRFWNLNNANSSLIGKPVTVKQIDQEDIKSLDYRSFKSFKPESTEQFNSVESSSDKLFILVTSKLPGQTKKVFVQNRIEPYDQSIMAVLSDLQSSQSDESVVTQNTNFTSSGYASNSFSSPSLTLAHQNFSAFSKPVPSFQVKSLSEIDEFRVNFKTVFYFKSYTNKPDFLILQELGAFKEPEVFLVDLYSKFGSSIGEQIGRLNTVVENFNYSVFKLNYQELKNLVASL
jgi:hypothetical protein